MPLPLSTADATTERGGMTNPLFRVAACIAAVLAVVAFVSALHVPDRPLAVALPPFLIVVLVASIGWGIRYSILLSFLAALGFSWSIPPPGHFHVADGRVWALLASCLVTGLTASGLSDRIRRALLEANQGRAEAVAERQRFADLVNSVDGIVWEADAETFTFTFVSEQAKRILGYPPQQWVSEPAFWKDRVHPGDREWAVKVCQQATAEKCSRDFEYRMISADGCVVWIRDLVTVVVENGRATRLRGVMVDVTRRKKVEEAVRRSEKELRDVIESIPAVAWSALADGCNAFVNRRWIEYTGMSASQTAGSGWQAAIHPEDVQRHVEAWSASVASGEPLSSEVRLRRADGQYRWHLLHGLALRDESGAILKWYGLATDIEDRKQAEMALHAAMAERTRLATFREEIGLALSRQEDLRGILQACADAMVRHLDGAFARIWTLSNDGRELELQASAGIYTRLDGSHSRIPFGHLKIGLIAQERKPHLTNDLQNDPRISDKDWARREKMLSFAGYPLILGRRVVGVMGMFSRKPLTETTLEALSLAAGGIAQGIERKRAEDALRRSEAYLTEAQKLTHTGSYAYDGRTNRFPYWSEEHFRIWGFDPREGPPDGEILLQRVHPEDRETVRERSVQALRERRDYTAEYRIVHPDGTLKYIEAIGHFVSTERGGPIEVIGTHVDVTERKLAEQEREKLRELEAELAHINRISMMGELAASLGHEIKQPIAAAITNAKTCLRWLKRDLPDLEEAVDAAARMVEDAMRAIEIINRTSSLYKKGVAQRELVNINEVINEIIPLLRNEAGRWEVSIRTDLAADAPSIRGDRIQLQQVLMNLAINAMDAMKAVDGPRTLTLSSKREDNGAATVSVVDTGVGLPAKTNHIFEAFYTTKSDGTGMGLAISRTIVESHGGSLSATSNQGGGATFYFTIPAATGVHA